MSQGRSVSPDESKPVMRILFPFSSKVQGKVSRGDVWGETASSFPGERLGKQCLCLWGPAPAATTPVLQPRAEPALHGADTGGTERREANGQGFEDPVTLLEGPVPQPALPLDVLECDYV